MGANYSRNAEGRTDRRIQSADDILNSDAKSQASEGGRSTKRGRFSRSVSAFPRWVSKHRLSGSRTNSRSSTTSSVSKDRNHSPSSEPKRSNIEIAKGLSSDFNDLSPTSTSDANNSIPSVNAKIVAFDWKLSTASPDSESSASDLIKNCNVTQEEEKHRKNRLSTPSNGGYFHSSVQDSSSGSDYGTPTTNRHLSEEVLLHIIRLFPFPSPRPSPKSSPRASPKNMRRRRSHEDPQPKPAHHSVGPSTSSPPSHNHNHIQQTHSAKKNNAHTDKARPNGGGLKNTMETLKLMVVNSVDTMAITALPLDCWLRERLKHFIQLSGHQGTIVPASDHTLWKKRGATDCYEANAYRKLMNDVVCPFVPAFKKEVEYKGENFIEIDDLTSRFTNPAIMDVKMGIRTFLESEVLNPVERKDLYQKMIKLDPAEPTEEEHAAKAVTKLRYMQFRERESSTHNLGFRVEAMKLPGKSAEKSFQKIKNRDEVMSTLIRFMGSKASSLRDPFIQRLKELRASVENSEFFKSHEVIGSSLLFMYDDENSGVWMIDFAKSLPIEGKLDHRSPWALGNHEDGYLYGLDNFISILEDTRHKELTSH